ncbi:hypothetical protein INH39_07975 [Massilia violaceinigra]|uniref:histidine kinase n=1 Tax=Massilia violaceinigra TaxID=2045208 RepID=A0ABY4AFV5_9BURK|nr:hypothetical protein [Massilia violaceinigra]UOD33696.1 hypothetical protein INH39_07975 [Massilia violaceinigra]
MRISARSWRRGPQLQVVLCTAYCDHAQLEGRLAQTEKLASIGRLAAGVAPEINNPLGFLSSNLQTLESYVGALLARSEGAPGAADGAELGCMKDDLPALMAIRAGSADGQVWIDVEDSGCGIGAQHLPLILDPFFTARRTRAALRPARGRGAAPWCAWCCRCARPRRCAHEGGPVLPACGVYATFFSCFFVKLMVLSGDHHAQTIVTDCRRLAGGQCPGWLNPQSV